MTPAIPSTIAPIAHSMLFPPDGPPPVEGSAPAALTVGVDAAPLVAAAGVAALAGVEAATGAVVGAAGAVVGALAAAWTTTDPVIEG